MRSCMLDNGPEDFKSFTGCTLERCILNLALQWIIGLKSDSCDCVFLGYCSHPNKPCLYPRLCIWLLFSIFPTSFFPRPSGQQPNSVRATLTLSFSPPPDKKLMSWRHTCEVKQTFKDQSGDFQPGHLTLGSPAGMQLFLETKVLAPFYRFRYQAKWMF